MGHLVRYMILSSLDLASSSDRVSIDCPDLTSPPGRSRQVPWPRDPYINIYIFL